MGKIKGKLLTTFETLTARNGCSQVGTTSSCDAKSDRKDADGALRRWKGSNFQMATESDSDVGWRVSRESPAGNGFGWRRKAEERDADGQVHVGLSVSLSEEMPPKSRQRRTSRRPHVEDATIGSLGRRRRDVHEFESRQGEVAAGKLPAKAMPYGSGEAAAVIWPCTVLPTRFSDVRPAMPKRLAQRIRTPSVATDERLQL